MYNKNKEVDMKHGHMQKWEPIRDLWDLSDDLNKFFFGFGHQKGEEETAMWAPTMDIYEDKEAIKVYVDLPGMQKKDVAISIEENVLTVKGERKFEEEDKKKNYYRIERSYGTFRRSFALPNNVDTGKISANMKDGILTIYVPKKEESKPKEIEINVS